MKQIKKINYGKLLYFCFLLTAAYLLIPSEGFKPYVLAGWTSLLVNAGEGIDMDLFMTKEPKDRIQQKLGQQIRINRSRIKDASDLRRKPL